MKQSWPLELATIAALSMASLILPVTPLPGSILTEDERHRARERWRAMTPDERGEARVELRERWLALSEEERIERRIRVHERLASLPPEESAQARRYVISVTGEVF